MPEEKSPFRVQPPKSRVLQWLWPVSRHLTGVSRVEKIVDRSHRIRGDGSLLDALNRATHIHADCSAADRERIPRTGPLLVVSNHPMGATDTQLISTLIESVRSDVKFIANEMLCKIPVVAERSLGVKILGKPSVSANMNAMREALRWLSNGGCLCVFPSGEVSHSTWSRWRPVDGQWPTQVAKMARIARPTVLPVFISGRNPWWFQLAGLFHPLLRTALLGHCYPGQQNRKIPVVVGTPIPAKEFDAFESDEELIGYFRLRTYLLRARLEEKSTGPGVIVHTTPLLERPQHAPEELAAEISGLPESHLLLKHGECEVWCTPSGEIPLTMLEIGRLREEAFRAVGEGSGKAIDIDRFDRSYRQLFIWNARTQEVMGGYRMGLTDEILAANGIDGLYTSTLFDYSPKMLKSLGPAIELGRSWVACAHQRRPMPLLMLWRGIAQFVLRHPKYAILLGPVSISDEYQSMSKRLIMAFLQTHHALKSFAKDVKPRNPPSDEPFLDWDPAHTRAAVRNVGDVDRLIREVEADGRTMPVLLRQYLKLNARLIAFNVDPDFGNVVDGLMFADLRQVPARVQEYYFGKENAEQFREFHRERTRT
ncbi:MAG: lysophospholipid acyltransferase family protein [Planctomycetes bacterium]|nr:lysophospholipid acyltransferase family protein [Planctomycetota bacterium]